MRPFRSFRMTSVPDEQDVPPFLDQPLRLPVDLRDQRTGRIDVGEAAGLRFRRN